MHEAVIEQLTNSETEIKGIVDELVKEAITFWPVDKERVIDRMERAVEWDKHLKELDKAIQVLLLDSLKPKEGDIVAVIPKPARDMFGERPHFLVKWDKDFVIEEEANTYKVIVPAKGRK